jgi:hypothetical protein
MHNFTRKHVFAFVAVTVALVAGLKVYADTVPTSVNVGNTAPSFTVAPAENPASDGTTPTNVGSAVTVQGTGTDASNENYYLAICKTNAITAVNGGAPTCPGTSWCISTSTTSASQASCSYTTLIGDAESNAWFAFVCDANSSNALCSASSQGTGSSGSPFKVNHRPAFSAASTTVANYNPGAAGTFQSTASDADTDTVADTVTLLVCKTAGVTGTACDGGGSDTWCTSSAAASNPTCNFSVPAVQPHGTMDAFVYIFDNHGFAANTATQGSNPGIVVNDVAPTVSAITLNGGSDIALTEGTTTNVSIGATVSDNNSCQDLTGVTTTVYRSAVTYASCDTGGEANANSCYAVITCSVTGGTCSSSTDASADYTCTASLQYHADPTDASTQFTAQNWLTTVIGTDGSTSTATQIGTGVEVLSLVGYDTTGSINYGSLSVGQSNDPLDKIVTVTATGNVGLDVELSGTDMTGGGTIAVGYQEYALAAATAYTAGTDLTTSATEVEIDVLKTTVTGTPQTKNSYWGLLIPNGTTPGAYTGSNTITAIKGEVAQW